MILCQILKGLTNIDHMLSFYQYLEIVIFWNNFLFSVITVIKGQYLLIY